MKDNEFQVGFLFNHFPELVFFKTELFTSNADMMLKMARIIQEDDSLTSDKKVFRDIRAGKYKLEDINELLASDGFDFSELSRRSEKLNSSPQEIGGWHVLLSHIEGFRFNRELRGHQDDTNINSYIDFIEAHCLLEHSFIQTARIKDVVDETWVNEIINTWLLTKNIDLFNGDNNTKSDYIISLVLYWTGLYEVLMHIEWGEDNYGKMLIKSIPRIGKGNTLNRSNEVCIVSTL